MKIALCLHGLVGSIKGKNYQMQGGSDLVLQKSYEHNKKYILNKNVDVFVHSWSTECEQQINKLYQPTKSIIEKQIQFEIPSYIDSDAERIFAHLSRWYSFKKSVELKTQYEQENGIIYDLVLVQRFDLCWNINLNFNSINTDKITVGKCTLDTNKEWSDRWFICNSTNINKFSTLYDMIPIYMGPNGTFTSKQQYAGISSHFLTRYHALQQGLQPEFKYMFGGHGGLPNDYNEVRRQYYGG